jgi:hypothetical protein
MGINPRITVNLAYDSTSTSEKPYIDTNQIR